MRDVNINAIIPIMFSTVSILNSLIFITVAINLITGTTILVRNHRSIVNKYFAGFVIFLSIWIVSNFLENEPGFIGQDNLALALRLDFAFAILFFFAWFHFCLEFLKRLDLVKKTRRWFTLSSFITTAIFSILSLSSDLIIRDITFDDVILFKEGGILLPYFIVILFYSLAGLVVLFLGGRRAKKQGKLLAKHQIDLIFWGYFVSISILMAINFTQPFYPISINVSRFGLYCLSFLSIITAYTITRRKLFDLKPVIARAVSFLVFIGLVAVVYASILILGIDRLLNINITFRMFLIFFAITIVAMFSFQPLQGVIKRFTNFIFFKGEYDSDNLLARLTKIMAETIDLEELTGKILNLLISEMHISKGAFVIVDDHKTSRVIGADYYKDTLANNREIEQLFHQYFLQSSYFFFDEIEENKIKELFRTEDIIFAMPLKVQADEVAILVLGSKLSGEFYNQKDINFLNVFGAEAGIAIQNAKSYRRIKELSKELEKKVEERTTELKTTQERELAKAKEVARLKDEFVFIAAHELRTPVTAIRGFLELTDIANTSFPKDIKYNLNAISDASSHLNQLITDLLEIARSDAGITTINTQPHEFEPILVDVLEEIGPLIKKKELTLNVNVKKAGPILCNPAKLKELLMNLLSNAIKYNRDRGTININAYQSPEGGYLMVEVEDTGYGIPQDQQSQIFQKFFRAPVKETQEVLGTGLGLFIVRMLVEKMGGKISFSSTEQKGTTFTFTVPFAPLQLN